MEREKKCWRSGCLAWELDEGTDNPFGLPSMGLTEEDKAEILDAVTLVLSADLLRDLYAAIMTRHSGFVTIEPPVAVKLKARADAIEELFTKVREQDQTTDPPRDPGNGS